MRNLLFTSIIFLMGSFLAIHAQTFIDNFDSSVADTVYNINSEGLPTVVTLADNHTDKHEGAGSMDFNASIGALHSWGSFAELVHHAPEGGYLDWSVNDTLSLWIKVRQAAVYPEAMDFRLQITDQPNPGGEIEIYVYQNSATLDAVTDWFELKVPLKQIPSDGSVNPTDSGFTVMPFSWGQPHNDLVLNLDKIVSYSIVAVTAQNVADSVKIGLDAYVRSGSRVIPFVFFNGKTWSSQYSLFVWGNSVVDIEVGAGATQGTNAVKWNQGDGWTGWGGDITGAYNMSAAWPVDSLKFKMKAPAGTGPCRAQFESGPSGSTSKVGTVFQPIDDGIWHQYALPLREMVPQDGTTNFDSSNVTLFGVMAENSGVSGRIIYLDDIWTGNPVIDVVAPNAPTDVTASAGTYTNTITWSDVPGEQNATYNVYYSRNPITNVTAHGVENVAMGILSGIGLADHTLRAPINDQNVTYYYAVTCMDEAGNISVVSANSAAVTNLAKGVVTISPVAPQNFTADGDLSDWAGITPIRLFPSEGAHIVTNTVVDNDADLSVLAYLAMDAQNLYIAFDVNDDLVVVDTNQSSYLNDCPDLFIGLYDWHGPSHNSLQRGAEPDYQMRFAQNKLLMESAGGATIYWPTSPNYWWQEKFEPGYVVEAKIPFTQIAAISGDDVFTPVIGKRIPLDMSINDADATGSREGIMTYSPNNEDNSYQNVSKWSYTWIGDLWTVGIEDQKTPVVKDYSLSQNFPNPFNPTTIINYSLKTTGMVTIKVYNVLGQEVATLVNEVQNTGLHTVNFNASSLSSGIYLYQIHSGNFTAVKKMMLVK